MRLATIVPLLLLCAPAAAGAQGGVEGQEAIEMKCVYAALSPAERAHLVAPGIGDAALDRCPLLSAHHRQLDLRHGPPSADEGQRRVERDVEQGERFPRATATMASHGPS